MTQIESPFSSQPTRFESQSFKDTDSSHIARDTAPASLKFDPSAAPRLEGSALCDQVRLGLEGRLGANKVRRYLGSGTVQMTPCDDGLVVSASDRFTLDMIERQIGDDLRSTLRAQAGNEHSDVRFSLLEDTPTGTPSVEPKPLHAGHTPGRHAGAPRVNQLVAGIAPAPARQGPRTPQPACPTIEGFLVGQSNKLAFGAVKALLESPLNSPPVFIHGSCGLGKTHLLRAAAQRYRQMLPGSKVRYITGEAFTNQFVQSVRHKTVDAFEKKFKGLDVLCLDDVHMVAGKESTQQELLQIFNTLALSGAKVIIASDAPPSEIARLHTGLASRFAGGVIARIDSPDRDLGLRIARQICLLRGMSIDDQGLGAILDRTGIGHPGSHSSVRELEGAIVQVQAVARLLEQDQCGSPSLTSIHRALQLRTGSNNATRAKGPISMDLITKVVTEHLGVTRQDLGGRGRHRTVVLARELIVFIARDLTTCSFPEIAHAIGRPNHSTVITAFKRIKGRIETHELCTSGGAPSGASVKGLADELTQRVRMHHRRAD